MTQGESGKILAYLKAAFPHAQLSEATCRVYSELLADLDYKLAQLASRRIAAEPGRKFFPTLGELRAQMLDLAEGRARVGAEAYGDVNAAVRRFGYYSAPRFSDPLVAQAVATLGWETICLSTNEESLRMRFVALYDQLAKDLRSDKVTGIPLGSGPSNQRLPAPGDTETGDRPQGRPMAIPGSLGGLLAGIGRQA